MEFEDTIYKVGDLVRVIFPGSIEVKARGSNLKGWKTPSAQIVGFHKDQFCEKYATVRWMFETEPLSERSSEYFDPTWFKEGKK
jgi:hypothetical protein